MDKLVILFFLQKENVMIQGDPRYDPDARKKKIADLKVKQPLGSPAVQPILRANQRSVFLVQIEATFKCESRGKLSKWSTENNGVLAPPSRSPLLSLSHVPPLKTAWLTGWLVSSTLEPVLRGHPVLSGRVRHWVAPNIPVSFFKLVLY